MAECDKYSLIDWFIFHNVADEEEKQYEDQVTAFFHGEITEAAAFSYNYTNQPRHDHEAIGLSKQKFDQKCQMKISQKLKEKEERQAICKEETFVKDSSVESAVRQPRARGKLVEKPLVNEKPKREKHRFLSFTELYRKVQLRANDVLTYYQDKRSSGNVYICGLYINGKCTFMSKKEENAIQHLTSHGISVRDIFEIIGCPELECNEQQLNELSPKKRARKNYETNEKSQIIF